MLPDVSLVTQGAELCEAFAQLSALPRLIDFRSGLQNQSPIGVQRLQKHAIRIPRVPGGCLSRVSHSPARRVTAQAGPQPKEAACHRPGPGIRIQDAHGAGFRCDGEGTVCSSMSAGLTVDPLVFHEYAPEPPDRGIPGAQSACLAS